MTKRFCITTLVFYFRTQTVPNLVFPLFICIFAFPDVNDLNFIRLNRLKWGCIRYIVISTPYFLIISNIVYNQVHLLTFFLLFGIYYFPRRPFFCTDFSLKINMLQYNRLFSTFNIIYIDLFLNCYDLLVFQPWSDGWSFFHWSLWGYIMDNYFRFVLIFYIVDHVPQLLMLVLVILTREIWFFFHIW